MKKIIIILFLLLSCSEKNYIRDYGEYLDVNFPNGIKKVYMKSHAEFQDYQNFSIYILSDNDRDFIINQIQKSICDTLVENNKFCWEQNKNTYNLKNSDSIIDSGYYFNAIIVDDPNMSAILIEEMKL